MDKNTEDQCFDHSIIRELKLFLSSKNEMRIINAVKYMLYTLKSYKSDQENYSFTSNVFITSDLPYFLCEALATRNFMIIVSVLKCWLYLSDAEIFFTHDCAINVLRVTARCISFTLNKSHNTELYLALQVIEKILLGLLKYKCIIEEFIEDVDYILQILVLLFESEQNVNHISVICCGIFETLLHTITENTKMVTMRRIHIIFFDAIKILKNSYDKYQKFQWIDKINNLCHAMMQVIKVLAPQAHDPFFESEEGTEINTRIEEILEICYNSFIDLSAIRYLSAESDLDPVPHSEPFLKIVLQFFDNEYTQPYRKELAYRISQLGILRRLKTIIYLGHKMKQIRLLCFECAAHILAYLGYEELQAKFWSKGLKDFRVDILEGFLELSEDPSSWFQVLADNNSSELAITSLLVYEYFELLFLKDRRYALLNTLPYLVTFISSMPEPSGIPRPIIKCLWFVFSCSYLSASTEEHIEGTTEANNWLLKVLVKEDIKNLYTNDFSLLLWAFSIPLTPKKLLSDLLILTITKKNDIAVNLEYLVQHLLTAKFILVDIISTQETEVADLCTNILLTTSPEVGELADFSKELWSYLATFLKDDNFRKRIIIFLRLCAYWPMADVPNSYIYKIFDELINIWSNCFDPKTTRKILFDQEFRSYSLDLMTIILSEVYTNNDQRALKNLFLNPRCLTAIDINTMSSDKYVADSSWKILWTITSLQKSSEIIELPLHPCRLLKLWSANGNNSGIIFSLRLVNTILDPDSPGSIVTIKWSKCTNSAIMYAQSITATLQSLCLSGFTEAWCCLCTLHKYASHHSLLLEPLAKFNFTHYLIRTEIRKGLIALKDTFLLFLITWFQLINKLDKKTGFIAERANNPLRKFSNCHFSHLLEETLILISKMLLHDKISHLDKNTRSLVAAIEGYILQHKDLLDDNLAKKIENHCSIIDI